jgi:formate hydrogenlyase subunit 3/multisubunit Na+/H+ antiporter MnhD subunit
MTTVAGRVIEFGWVIVIYLMSELTIWGLSRALAPVHLEFFSSIFGMVLTFCFMAAAFFCFAGIDDIYQRHIKSKVPWPQTSPMLAALTAIAGRFHQRPFGLGFSHSSGDAEPKRHSWWS